MQVCGIVTEYNPFHNGHQYHITQARSIRNCDCLIAIMSGNFVQRGEPAIIDKWERAACAVAHGVDIVMNSPILMQHKVPISLLKEPSDCLRWLMSTIWCLAVNVMTLRN